MTQLRFSQMKNIPLLGRIWVSFLVSCYNYHFIIIILSLYLFFFDSILWPLLESSKENLKSLIENKFKFHNPKDPIVNAKRSKKMLLDVGGKYFICHECFQEFKTYNKLNTHYNMHGLPAPPYYECIALDDSTRLVLFIDNI